MDRNDRYVRLYPVPFRDLENSRRFKKYQWVRLKVQQRNSDSRPESYAPNYDTLEVISEPLSTDDAWRERREIVLSRVAESLCDIQDAQKRDGASLGIFKPAEIIDFDWEPDEQQEWTDTEQARLAQQDLFMTREKKLLEKIPYTFRYRFRCADCRVNEPHHMKVVDWELAQMYRKLRRESESIDDCLTKIRDKWLVQICDSQKYDTYFFVGNMRQFPQSFLVLGVFWPPREVQMRLF
uniref:Uncharacterized protein n=1 Tax=Candidatus Kentrum sp. LPFa TaxID=2126335 RepID=A0A450WQ20_9GAMM|nr:MAG: hypothetical protein BECKLPF1236B_GA0070989_11615 [Candidatus Kentron sp. LPFa]